MGATVISNARSTADAVAGALFAWAEWAECASRATLCPPRKFKMVDLYLIIFISINFNFLLTFFIHFLFMPLSICLSLFVCFCHYRWLSNYRRLITMTICTG